VSEDRRVLSKSAQYRRLLKMYGSQQAQQQPLATGAGDDAQQAQQQPLAAGTGDDAQQAQQQQEGASNGGGAANDGCEMCQFVVQYIKIALASNETVAQVRRGPGRVGAVQELAVAGSGGTRDVAVQHIKIALASNTRVSPDHTPLWRSAAPPAGTGMLSTEILSIHHDHNRKPSIHPLIHPQIMHNLDRACETFSLGSGGESGELERQAG